jgi:hypothetical protein
MEESVTGIYMAFPLRLLAFSIGAHPVRHLSNGFADAL